MSTTPLSDIQELIERSLFERIRLELIDKGYLPDITSYQNNQAGLTQWNADLVTIKNTKGFAIEVFTESSNFKKGIKKVPRIVLKNNGSLPGALGGDPSRFFTDTGYNYQAKVTPPQTVEFYMNFHLVSDTVIQERVLTALLALVIPRRGYIPWYNDNTKSFFVRFLNSFDLDDNDTGILERVYAYEVPDVWDTEDIEKGSPISKITRIDLHINLQKYLIGEFGYETTPLIVWSSLHASITGSSTLTANLTAVTGD